MMAGATTELIASSTVGVAEDSVRFFEDFAGSIAFTLDDNQSPGDTAQPSTTPIKAWSNGHSQEPSVSFGEEKHAFKQESSHALSGVGRFGRFLVRDVEGVPSMTPEIIVVLLVCFATMCLSRTRGPGRKTQTLALEQEKQRFRIRFAKGTFKRSASFDAVFSAVQVPLRLCLKLSRPLRTIVCNRMSVVFCFYLAAALYLTYSAQLRAETIRRYVRALHLEVIGG